jgi:hypothetical protein
MYQSLKTGFGLVIGFIDRLQVVTTIHLAYTVRVFEKRVLRRIFGLKRDEVIGGWSKLHNEELHKFYSSPSIIRVIKSRRINEQGM